MKSFPRSLIAWSGRGRVRGERGLWSNASGNLGLCGGVQGTSWGGWEVSGGFRVELICASFAAQQSHSQGFLFRDPFEAIIYLAEIRRRFPAIVLVAQIFLSNSSQLSHSAFRCHNCHRNAILALPRHFVIISAEKGYFCV